jgi:hypothetical protein
MSQTINNCIARIKQRVTIYYLRRSSQMTYPIFTSGSEPAISAATQPYILNVPLDEIDPTVVFPSFVRFVWLVLVPKDHYSIH